MEHPDPSKTEEILKKHKKWKIWAGGVMAAAVVVVVITAYMLTLPAITMERKTICGKEEHVHTESCYEVVQVTSDTGAPETAEDGTPVQSVSETQTILTCVTEEHQHTEACFAAESVKETVPESQNTESCGSESKKTETESSKEDDVQETEESIENTEETELKEETESKEETKSKEKKRAAKAVAGPIALEPYVTNIDVYYREAGGGEDAWKPLTNDVVDIPGNADVKLYVHFEKVSIDTLMAANGQMTCKQPAILKNPHVQGQLNEGDRQIGTITVNGDTALLAFDMGWLESKKAESNDVIGGEFYAEANFDLSKIDGDNNGRLEMGDVDITIDFEEDVLAKNADVHIQKTVNPLIIEDEDGEYLEYTLTVSVPADSADVPDVTVKDVFSDRTWIQEYVCTDGMTVQDDGTMVWTIGPMKAGETRTLTYRVKLKEGYTGIHTKPTILNRADLYSDIYWRERAEAVFTPSAGATLSKIAGAWTPDDKGGGTIDYTVWVKALDKNSYTLDNVKIIDSLENASNMTLKGILPYLSYDESSFHLYKGGENKQNGAAGLEEILPLPENLNPGKKNPDISSTNKTFNFYVGDLKPGECKTLTYKIKVAEGAFAQSNNTVTVKNRALIFSDDTRADGNKQFNAYNQNKDIGKKVWNRKIHSTALVQNLTVPISADEEVYNAPGVVESPKPSEFQIPAGGHEYKVAVNEAGDWDLSAVDMRDTMGSFMQFMGYLKVSAYTIENPPDPGQSDAQAVAGLEALTPVKTAWLKIDGTNQFAFQPKQLGLEGKYAYLLTYYAVPQNLGDLASVVVTNEFNVSGDATGPGGSVITIPGIDVDTSVTVESNNHYGARKSSWYYEWPKDGVTGAWGKGELYWIIRVDGNVISKSVQIKDIPSSNNHALRTDSLVGVYKGVLPEGRPMEDYENYDDFLAAAGNGMVPLAGNRTAGEAAPEGSDYSWQIVNNQMILDFEKDIVLDETSGEAVYIIVKTAPTSLPAGDRAQATYKNNLQTSGDNGNTWKDANEASKALSGNNGTFKENGGVYTYNGREWKTVQNGQYTTIGKVKTDRITEPGTYVVWQVHANWYGELEGRVKITDQLPKGMEPVYVRYFWMSPDYIALGMPVVPKLTGDEVAGWTENTFTAKGDGNTMSGYNLECNYYYNASSGQLRWDVDGLKSGGAIDRRSVEFQVVCKLTDEELLQGSGSKFYNNTVVVTDSKGREYADAVGVTIEKSGLSKTGTYDPAVNGNIYPFKITVNELGEDLVSGDGNTITLVDELSKTLVLDITSIEVVNTKDPSDTILWTSSIETTERGQILRLVLPDDKPLTITYETRVNAAPGQSVDLFNKAHWEGYESPDGGSILVEGFSYKAGGIVITDNAPKFKLIKLDQADSSRYLAGAEFKLEEVVMNGDGIFTAVTDDGKTSDTVTTGNDGTALFGYESGDHWMTFNHIYRLTEISAPEGYILDETPYYFAIAKATGKDTGGNPTYPEELKTWQDAGVTVYYGGAEYVYVAYNRKGEAAVEKLFLEEDGTEVASGSEPNGSYRFGLFDTAQNGETAGTPLQILTITYMDGNVTYKRGGVSVDRPNFINLDFDRTYYIYELDDSNRPVTDGDTASVDGRTFTVSYSSNGIEINKGNQVVGGIPAVTVTNQAKAFELPETGGTGTFKYIFGGALLIGISTALLYKRKKEREEECL